ncbi:glutathione S-transferase family protein [Ferrovibrio xuzhouensis]|uniref:Glutathione S-transferase family protein n=1 Tax=Ferrovibrio xuzhouensis TaxID=1576914 RepID=A0ABV7VKI3_9PROT
MSAPLTLYSGPLSMFGAKAEIAAREKGLRFELVMVPFAMATLYSPKHPEVERINPKRQVPVLVHRSNGGPDLELFDSTQIFEYLEDLAPDPALWPRETAARARARQLELLSDEIYFPHIIRLMGLQQTPDDPAAIAARGAAAGFYGRIEGLLADGRAWLAGADYTYADIAFFMACIFGDRMGAPIPDQAAHLIAWRTRMSERPAVRQVAGAMGRWLLGQHRPLPAFVQAMV